MNQQELLDTIAFNVIQGRLESEDEGFDPGLEGRPVLRNSFGRRLSSPLTLRIS